MATKGIGGIHATIGPKSSDRDVLQLMCGAGTAAIRINLSHIEPADLPSVTAGIRRVSPSISIGADIRGRKLRIGLLDGGRAQLSEGDEFTLIHSNDSRTGDKSKAFINFPNVSSVVNNGIRILLDDGAVSMKVIENTGDRLLCKVERAGEIYERCGVNLPGVVTNLPPLTGLDMEFISLFKDSAIDYVYLSFVEDGGDVERLRSVLDDIGLAIPIVAKVELLTAVKNIEGIAEASDAVCLARGDLGTEVPFIELPSVQRDVIRKVKGLNVPFLLAGEVLFSLVGRRTPFRAELTDLYTAIVQGVDGFVLSDETAIGIDPVNAVRFLSGFIKGMNGVSTLPLI